MVQGELRVSVAIPSPGVWVDDFGMSLLGLTVATMSEPVRVGSESRKVVLIPHKHRSSILPNARNFFMEEALRAKSDYLLFVDTDQTFPPDTLRQLLKWDVPVVAANIATREKPAFPTARKKSDKLGGDPVYSIPGVSKGLETVWRVGTGVMLVNLHTIRRLSNKVEPEPWFSMEWTPAQRRYEGEDWGFCRWLEERKVPIRIDHDLSLQIGHVGSYRFTHADVELPVL